MKSPQSMSVWLNQDIYQGIKPIWKNNINLIRDMGKQTLVQKNEAYN
jgi:hypothetical protein